MLSFDHFVKVSFQAKKVPVAVSQCNLLSLRIRGRWKQWKGIKEDIRGRGNSFTARIARESSRRSTDSCWRGCSCQLTGSEKEIAEGNLTMAGKTVTVTGATGFIASYLVKDLLERGYTVRGTVRNPDDVSKVGFLLALPGAKERLTLYKANLLEEGSFDTVVDGVDGVFHTASPYLASTPKDPQAELIDPALKGTLNLLESANKATSVKRVVLTSSIAAMRTNRKPRTPTTLVDESSWSDIELCKERGAWYVLSKTLAEQAAWDFVKGKHFDLVVVNPAYVLGTMLQPSLNTSNGIIRDYLSGTTKKYENNTMGFVDVKDVSLGHILAYEKPEAKGRYLLIESVVTNRELVEILHKLYPGYPVTTEPEYDLSQEIPTYLTDTEKAQKLGLKFRSLESQLVDTVTSLQEKGYLQAVPKN